MNFLQSQGNENCFIYVRIVKTYSFSTSADNKITDFQGQDLHSGTVVNPTEVSSKILLESKGKMWWITRLHQSKWTNLNMFCLCSPVGLMNYSACHVTLPFFRHKNCLDLFQRGNPWKLLTAGVTCEATAGLDSFATSFCLAHLSCVCSPFPHSKQDLLSLSLLPCCSTGL